MSTTRLDEIGIFLLSNIFTSKLNAMGIANLPTAITTVRAAWKDDGKKTQGRIIYAAGIFNALVVVSGLTGRWPWLIKSNAIANILNGVKESISARRKAESLSEEEVNQERPRKRSMISNFIKNRFFPSQKDPTTTTDAAAASSVNIKEEDAVNAGATKGSSASTGTETATKPVPTTSSLTSSSLKKRFFSSRKPSTDSSIQSTTTKQATEIETSKRKKAVKKAQALLAGKRESSADDVIWAIFQISMICFDYPRWKAIGHAWLVFLLRLGRNRLE